MNKQLVARATDEAHIVMWDIDALLADHRDCPRLRVNTQPLIPQNWLQIDEAYAMTTDVAKPLILFELPKNQLFLADGNHRLYRAAAEHIPQMDVIILPQDVHLSYLYQSTREIYRQVIAGLEAEGIFIPSFLQTNSESENTTRR